MDLSSRVGIFVSCFLVCNLVLIGADAPVDKLRTCLISSGLNGNLVVGRTTNSSSQYSNLNYQWQQRGGLIQPRAYLLPEKPNHVQAIVSCSKKAGLRLVTKSGGHSLAKYSFGDSKSIVLDLQRLNSVQVNKDTGTVDIGAGAIVAEIFWRLWHNGKNLVSNGICPSVGISGYSTGGGNGFFASKYGLASDEVVEMDLVNANGTLLTASSTKNPDLFWALRGGVAASFGVVTRIRMRTHPAPPLMNVTMLEFKIEQFPEVFHAWETILESNPPPNLARLIGVIQDRKIYVMMIELPGEGMYTTTWSLTQKVAATFPPPIDGASELLTLDVLVDKYVSKEPKSEEEYKKIREFREPSVYFTPKSFFVNQTVSGAMDLIKLNLAIQLIPKSVRIFFEHYGGVVNDISPSETAFVHRNPGGFLYLWQIGYREAKPTIPEKMKGTSWVKSFWSESQKIFKHTESYQNYQDADLKDYLERYFGSNLPKLIKVKRQVDPENFFRFPQSIPLEYKGL